MNIGLRTHKSASLRIAVAEGLPDEMRPGTREIISVRAENSRKGHASALMCKVCNEADRQRIVLLLEAKPFDDGMNEDQLMRWYGRFGFIRIQDEPVLMARQPLQ